MIETISLFPGVTLRCCRDRRFKQGCLTFQLVRPMAEEEAALNALLPAVLMRGTRNYPDMRAITHRLDALYGASVSPLVRRVGDYHTTGLYCGFMDDRFALPGDKVLAPMLSLLEELLLDSPLVDGGFLPEFVESEKQNLIATIEAELNDKRAYAMNQMMRLLCREDTFRIPRLGEKEAVAAITPKALRAHYETILREAKVEIFYVGSAESDQVAQLLMPLLGKLSRDHRPMPPQGDLRRTEPSDVTERMDVNQGKLCMGFVTPITNRTPDFPAMQVLNTLFGAGMTSKLFQNVREKLSLCYSVGSGYYGSKGIIAVSAGIDFDKEKQTREEILRQLRLCQEGEITDCELSAAREAILSSLRASHDSPGAIEGYYATCALSGMALTTQAYAAAVEQVTREQVVAAANTITLHTTYFLKGVSQ